MAFFLGSQSHLSNGSQGNYESTGASLDMIGFPLFSQLRTLKDILAMECQ